jgi:hypothetical protein
VLPAQENNASAAVDVDSQTTHWNRLGACDDTERLADIGYAGQCTARRVKRLSRSVVKWLADSFSKVSISI